MYYCPEQHHNFMVEGDTDHLKTRNIRQYQQQYSYHNWKITEANLSINSFLFCFFIDVPVVNINPNTQIDLWVLLIRQ